MNQLSSAPTWQRLGAWAGGPVLEIALSPTFAVDGVALAATTAGLYRTDDGGDSWWRKADELADPSFLAVAFAPANRPGQVCAYAASESGRLYTTLDSGLSWQEVTGWSGLGQVTQLRLSPGFDQDRTLFVATGAGVFRTQDGGLHWESATFGLHDLEALCLALAPDFAASEVIWCGTAAGGLYRSRNAARSWRDSGQGLPDDAVTALLVSSTFAEDRSLFAGTDRSGLFASTDGGASWQLLHAAAEDEAVATLATIGGRLLLGTTTGVCFSDDQGLRWQPAAGAPAGVTTLAADRAGVVLAATTDGIYRSQDSGASWQMASAGLVAHAPPVVSRLPGGVLLALDRAGALARSTDEGRSWQQIAVEREQAGITAMAFAAATGRLFVATAEGELYRAHVDEAIPNWEVCPIQAPAEQFFEQILALDGAAGCQLLLAASDGQLYRWSEGEDPTALAEDLPWSGSALLQLACSPTFADDRRLVAITTQPNQQGNYAMQAWESSDRGLTWQALASFESEAPAVALAWPHDPGEESLFLATRNRIIRIYRPGGEGEQAVAQHFLADEVRCTMLAVSPAFELDHRLWAATSAGVLASTDAGATWSRPGDELVNRPCVGIFPLDEGGALLAVELGGTVWRYQG